MLSYVMPVEEKPPLGPGIVKTHQLQLELANGHSAPAPFPRSALMSKESSISSFASDVTTATSSMTPTSDRPRAKLLANGTKHTGLKRVSFGSSKGSMVETLIYESPLHEEPENSPSTEHSSFPFPMDAANQAEAEKSTRVRVTFYQQSAPLVLDAPCAMSTAAPEPQSADATAAVATIAESNHVLQYNRQDSTESGWDNPFRPGGELSREAEQIVELIKEGKPITPTSLGPTESQQLNDSNNSAAVTVPDGVEQTVVQANSTPVAASNKSAVNGNKPSQTSPAPIDVKRDTVGVPVDGTQVEHVVLKKKQKRCKCCVIQ